MYIGKEIEGDVDTKEKLEKVVTDPDTLAVVKGWLKEGSNVACYQNHDMGHPNIGHLRFLKVGPTCTFKEAPKPRLPDFPAEINWRYQFVGLVTP